MSSAHRIFIQHLFTMSKDPSTLMLPSSQVPPLHQKYQFTEAFAVIIRGDLLNDKRTIFIDALSQRISMNSTGKATTKAQCATKVGCFLSQQASLKKPKATGYGLKHENVEMYLTTIILSLQLSLRNTLNYT